MYLGLNIEVRLKKLKVCQLPKNGLIWEFFKYFLYKIKIERGVHLKKNFANSRIWYVEEMGLEVILKLHNIIYELPRQNWILTKHSC